MFYSAQTNSFYSVEINGDRIPGDAVEISLQEHEALMLGQSAGSFIVPDEFGRPALQGLPETTLEQALAAKEAVVQDHMDAIARSLSYESMADAITYAEEPAVPKFQYEGQALRAWRSLVRAHYQQVFADVLSGSRAIPTDEDLIAELPGLDVPLA